MVKKSSLFRFSIHNKTFFKYLWYFCFVKRLKNQTKKQRLKQKLIFNYKINIEKPRTFNEYLLWIKNNYRNDLWCRCADKLKCKDFLIEKGFGQYVPKTLGIYSSTSDIVLDNLPDEFLLKTNHDSGSVYHCKKSKTDFNKIFNLLDKSINNNYASNTFEWFYDGIKPLIFVEEALTPSQNTYPDLVDYKLFCFNGKFKFGFVARNRNKDVKFILFEDDYKFAKCEYTHLRGKKSKIPQKPTTFDEMIDIAERIASNFDFVRVDMFDTDKGPMIGELTFISMGGFGPFTKKAYDFKYGGYFKDTCFYQLVYGENKK